MFDVQEARYEMNPGGIVRNVNGFPAYCSLLRNHCFTPHCETCDLWQPYKPDLMKGNHDPAEWLMRWIARSALEKKYIFESYYKTASGEWTENIDDAYWYQYAPRDDLDAQPWNKNFKTNIKGVPPVVLTCDTRHEEYWIIAGKRYDDYDGAVWAMYDELFCKPAVIPVMGIIFSQLTKAERKHKLMTQTRKT